MGRSSGWLRWICRVAFRLAIKTTNRRSEGLGGRGRRGANLPHHAWWDSFIRYARVLSSLRRRAPCQGWRVAVLSALWLATDLPTGLRTAERSGGCRYHRRDSTAAATAGGVEDGDSVCGA